MREGSPFESLFGGSLFGNDLMEDFFGDRVEPDAIPGTAAGAPGIA